MAGTYIAYDFAGRLGLSSSEKILYQTYWNSFERVQAYNIHISTLRSGPGGDKTQEYYIFYDNEERVAYINGRMLHIQRYPNSNWAEVSKD
jgi:hypothetical protein